ncbi:enoyl-CoA hydratase/isomerase family protein [Nocardia sp. NPDC059246]|uniref:enoyl-CoA hydratase/isomerase family protein n=1 Tax=unclassified Nocardia TaxID=2637762 RepID=UPI0036AB2571
MEYTVIQYKVDDRVAWLTLDQPKKLNPLSIKLCAEFQDALRVAERDPEVRVIVVKGAGHRAFSVGHDMADQHGPRTLEDSIRHNAEACKFIRSVFDCPKPVIAMIDGYCLGMALGLAMMCDIRYCSDDSQFGAIETRLALGSTEIPMMSHLMGQRSRELAYTGDIFDANEAYRLGLANRIFPKESLEEETTRIAKRMSRVALPTLMWSKKAFNTTLTAAGIDSALQHNFATYLLITQSDSEFKRFDELLHSEGVKAALQWRDSIFEPFESGTS